MPIPYIKVATGRQPVLTKSTTGLNATRNPGSPNSAHVVSPHTRLKNQVPTATPGKTIIG